MSDFNRLAKWSRMELRWLGGLLTEIAEVRLYEPQRKHLRSYYPGDLAVSFFLEILPELGFKVQKHKDESFTVRW